MAKAGIRRSQAPNLCHAEAKIGPKQDISLPRCRRLTSRRSSRTVAPKSSQSPGTVFTQPGSIVEDCYKLAWLRWGGIVPEGWRDIFGHVIACQLARIFDPVNLYREIVAAVSRILPAGYVARDLSRHCSTLLRLAREEKRTATRNCA